MRAWKLVIAGAAFGLLAPVPAMAVELPDFTQLIEAHAPVVVNISTTRNAEAKKSRQGKKQEVPEDMPELFRHFLERQRPMPRPRRGNGSGMIYSADGYIVTNHHVVDNVDEIIVKLSDKREFTAELVGSDPRSDLALLKIEAEGLPTATFGNSAELKVGQWVLAIGSPFGFEHSATVGIVSAKGRSLPSENYIPFIQTDVAINPGNSGGPLFDLDGRVVGINAQIYTRTGGFMGLSFAIPIDMVSEVIAQIRKDGRVMRGWLGVYIQEVTRELAKSFGLDRPKGALISAMTEDSPAADSELAVGDIILEFDGKPVPDSASLPPLVGRTPPDSDVPVVIMRDGKRKTITVTLGELPADGEEQPARTEQGEGASGKTELLGMRLGMLPEAERKRRNLDGGVRVEQVTGDPARAAGLQRGDIIQTFAGRKIVTLKDFEDTAKTLEAGRPYPLLVQRRQGSRWLALTPD